MAGDAAVIAIGGGTGLAFLKNFINLISISEGDNRPSERGTTEPKSLASMLVFKWTQDFAFIRVQ